MNEEEYQRALLESNTLIGACARLRVEFDKLVIEIKKVFKFIKIK